MCVEEIDTRLYKIIMPIFGSNRIDVTKTKQNIRVFLFHFVISNWGKGDSYNGGLDVSLKN